VGPEPSLSAASFTADREVNRDLSIRLGFGRTFGEEEGTSLQAGTVVRTPIGDVALSADYATPTEDWRVNMRLAFGLVHGLRGRGYALTRPGPSAGASAAFHAFIDTDGDGAFDPGEAAVEKAAVEGGEREAATGKDGRTFVTGLGASPRARLQVKLDAIEDPYLQSPPQAVEFAPRAGLVVKVPYPLTPTGDVMAKVVMRKGAGRLTGLSAVRVRLVGESGRSVEAVTEFDGSAHFEKIPAGVYRLALDEDQAVRLGMRFAEPVMVVMDPVESPIHDLTAEVEFQLRGPNLIAEGPDLIGDLLQAALAPPTPDVIGDLLVVAFAPSARANR
jgi:hypothetical protein